MGTPRVRRFAAYLVRVPVLRAGRGECPDNAA